MNAEIYHGLLDLQFAQKFERVSAAAVESCLEPSCGADGSTNTGDAQSFYWLIIVNTKQSKT